MVRSLRFGFVLLAVLLAVGVVAAIASAGPAVTETVTGKDTDNFVDVAPTCEGGGPLFTHSDMPIAVLLGRGSARWADSDRDFLQLDLSPFVDP